MDASFSDLASMFSIAASEKKETIPVFEENFCADRK
jgi:hypothetical protein